MLDSKEVGSNACGRMDVLTRRGQVGKEQKIPSFMSLCRLPAECMIQNKSVSSCLKIQIKGVSSYLKIWDFKQNNSPHRCTFHFWMVFYSRYSSWQSVIAITVFKSVVACLVMLVFKFWGIVVPILKPNSYLPVWFISGLAKVLENSFGFSLSFYVTYPFSSLAQFWTISGMQPLLTTSSATKLNGASITSVHIGLTVPRILCFLAAATVSLLEISVCASYLHMTPSSGAPMGVGLPHKCVHFYFCTA